MDSILRLHTASGGWVRSVRPSARSPMAETLCIAPPATSRPSGAGQPSSAEQDRLQRTANTLPVVGGGTPAVRTHSRTPGTLWAVCLMAGMVRLTPLMATTHRRPRSLSLKRCF
jgi:hypothetical protein